MRARRAGVKQRTTSSANFRGSAHVCMPMLLVATFALSCAAIAPQTPPQCLGACRSLAVVEGVGNCVSVAPDGSRVGVIDHEAAVARVVDAETGEVTALGERGRVRALALGSAGRGWCTGRSDGVVRVRDADGAARDFKVLEGRPIDGVVFNGSLLAWSSSAADRGGVIDLRTDAELLRVEARFGAFRRPRVQLSRDGRHALYLVDDPARGGRPLLSVVDARTGERVATAPTYVSKRDSSVAAGLDRVFTAERVNAHDWHLRRLDLVSLESTVVDEDLRGRHFVDLLLSPDGRHLLEGDQEERGAVLYALTDGGGKRTLGGAGTLPVGFLRSHGRRGELALTTVAERRGLRAWSVATGELAHASVEALADRRVVFAGSLRGGEGIWALWWKAHRGAVVYCLEVLSVGG